MSYTDVCSDIDSDEYYLKLHSTGFPLTYEHNFNGCRGITQSSDYFLVTFYYFDTEPDHDFVAVSYFFFNLKQSRCVKIYIQVH